MNLAQSVAQWRALVSTALSFWGFIEARRTVSLCQMKLINQVTQDANHPRILQITKLYYLLYLIRFYVHLFLVEKML
jgi:hypothetical protein